MNSKSQLRLEAKQEISELKDKAEKSAVIVEKLLELEKVMNSNSILLYSPTEYEVDINDLRYRLIDQGKNVYLPYAKKLSVGLVRKDEDLKMNDQFKILEPVGKRHAFSLHTGSIDVAIIPGLSFDKQGYRLGYGSGWYDRFLSMHPEIFKIGVCFDELLVDKLPHKKHDVSMGVVITDTAQISSI